MTNDKTNHSQTAAFIWSVADLLRGDFKQSQYGRVILPFTLLRRLECVLEPNKVQVLAAAKEHQTKPDAVREKLLLRAADLQFFNASPLSLGSLSDSQTADDLMSYVQSFSKDAREIFEHFYFEDFVQQLSANNLLYQVVQRFASIDLSPNSISNFGMGLIFEELIRKFAESSNETAGEHFTPRDIVHLTTSLVLTGQEKRLSPSSIVTIYDPTAGTGGFLSEGDEYIQQISDGVTVSLHGQELNPESYAICKADMLIKGQDVSNIKLGNTLSDDQLATSKFDIMLSNPPFGVEWKKVQKQVSDEHKHRGFDGRFGPGLPRVSDGSLLFLLHLVSKMRDAREGGSRIGIILNGSPLFTGSAGSGESEIRRYLLQSDLVEAIVALPTDMFYNTGIATYVWVLSNKKADERKGKVQLINGVNLYSKMRKSLGSKRNEMSDSDIATIIRSFGAFEVEDARELDKAADVKSNRGRQSASPKVETPKTFASKIFDSHEFGYRRITIERPLRESYQFSDARIAELRFDDKQLNAAMKWVYDSYGQNWSDSTDCASYGVFNDDQIVEIRVHCKANFSELKEAKIKELLNKKTWIEQKQIMLKAKQLQSVIDSEQHDDMNGYDKAIKAAMKALDIKIEARDLKQITAAVSWKNPAAEKVIKKVHKAQANPLYGLFEVNGKTIEYQADSELRDNENVPLDPSQSVDALNEAYFIKEVQPHVPDAWIDASKKDVKDQQIGIVGYEIPFNRHFYEYHPPRDLAEIDADLDAVSAEIMALLQEVHS